MELLPQLQFIKHGLHLAQSMLIAGASRARDAVCQLQFGFICSPSFRQRLRGHEISCRVLGVVSKQALKFQQRCFHVSLAGVLHSEAVACKRVFRVLREYFGEGCNFVHPIDYFAANRGKQPVPTFLALIRAIAETGE